MKKIGISILTLLTHAYGRKGPEKVLTIMEEAGLHGLQLVPLRAGWTEESLRAIPPEKIISYEGPWGNSLAEKLLFKKNLTKIFERYFSRSLAIDLPGKLVEISPNHPYDEIFYRKYTPGLVFDSWHFKTLGVQDKNDFINELLKNKLIKLIHFQTRDKKELNNFLLSGRLSILFTRVIKESDCPIIIELPFYWVDKKLLAEIGEKIQNL